ncbi:hypothetical protein KIH27_10590 [Mycobacterium sp. M1]|uniref:Ribbon-helix-helix protein CopG domain-containing protein n=1 Tax=Mycolicibacter acidiphilus TaxID=2835306 RepID=A0ABS5RIB0_9MYCO|nr:hypothetical protein [Mycolicibacter acidiphilus]MBS9534032.1 hypothetical protein [Mycolicibacter acidiphilus]
MVAFTCRGRTHLPLRRPHLRKSLKERAAAEAATPAEIIRRALVEYLDRHPA